MIVLIENKIYLCYREDYLILKYIVLSEPFIQHLIFYNKYEI